MAFDNNVPAGNASEQYVVEECRSKDGRHAFDELKHFPTVGQRAETDLPKKQNVALGSPFPIEPISEIPKSKKCLGGSTSKRRLRISHSRKCRQISECSIGVV